MRRNTIGDDLVLRMHERVMLVAFSLNNGKSFNINLWLIFPTLFIFLPFSFPFILFPRPGKDDDDDDDLL